MSIATNPKAKIKDPKINFDEFEEVPKISVEASKMLTDTYIQLGRPQTPLTNNGAKMMEVIIAVWEDMYPMSRDQWYAERREYQKEELSLSEQVSKHTGRSLASYPLPIYNIMKKLFPQFDPTDRKNCIKLIKKWPMFRLANRI